jgi:V8-like Glu-specific endopeptidase
VSLDAAAAATAAVRVDGHRRGSAVLIDRRYVLTAAHVLRRTVKGQKEPVDRAKLVFPAVHPPAGRAEAAVDATRMPAPPGAHSLDVAVLDLGEQPLDWLPAPVPLSPARRLPPRVIVFGFPLAEPDLRGVWREFDTAGPTAGGTVQADWVRLVGTLRGHSGGPVLDPATGSVVGVLVEAPQRDSSTGSYQPVVSPRCGICAAPGC